MGGDSSLGVGAAEPDWRRSSYGMAAVVFIAFFGFNFVIPILPLYVRQLGIEDVGQAALVSGLMLAISPLMAAFFSPLWGLVADRYGRKRMVQRAMLVMVVCTILMGFVANAWQLFLLRAAIGIFGGFTAMAMAYLVTVTPPYHASAALGLLQSAQMGGVIIGPLCAGFVADHFGLRWSFLTGAVVVFCGFLVLTLLTKDDRPIVSPDKQRTPAPQAGAGAGAVQPPKRGGLGALREAARLPGLVPLMVILFLTQFVDRSFGPVLPLYVATLGTPEDRVASFAGLIVSLGALATAASAAISGRLALTVPPRKMLIGMLLLGMAVCLPMVLVQSPVQLLVARTLLGLFSGGAMTLAYSLANAAVPAERKGAAFGVLSSTTLLGSASSPLAIGAVSNIDLRSVFLVDSALYAIATLWTLRIRPTPFAGEARRAE